ncbi:MAG: hypothetical protein Q9227_009518 [Pyrenula ochraceoflavens]
MNSSESSFVTQTTDDIEQDSALRSPIEMQRSSQRSSRTSLLSSQDSSDESLRRELSYSSRKQKTGGLAKHTLGLILLLCTIFADNTYAKPFFVTYINTSVFTTLLIPILSKRAYRRWLYRRQQSRPKSPHEPTPYKSHPPGSKHLGILPTARLALSFCVLWFLANYFAMACLQHTTVASATILTSTSSIWTLIIGSLARVEKFTFRKLLGVIASLCGIIIISRADLSNKKPENNPSSSSTDGSTFPSKPPSELFLGDILAFLSAVIYGLYTISLKLKTRTPSPSPSQKDSHLTLHMPLFFSLVGLLNTLFLLPLFPLFHFTHLEPFAWPPTRRIWSIILLNSISSLASDVMWAYAMVLTSPLVVTVGLSLTIPCSLVGEMLVQGRVEGWVYWVGAAVVVGGFAVVDGEEVREEKEGEGKGERGAAGRREGQVVVGRDLEEGREEEEGLLGNPNGARDRERGD